MPIPISSILNRNPNDLILFEEQIKNFIIESNILIFEKLETSFAIFDRFLEVFDLKKGNNQKLAKSKNFAIKFTTFGNRVILLWFQKIDCKTFVNIFCYCEDYNINNFDKFKKYLLNIFAP